MRRAAGMRRARRGRGFSLHGRRPEGALVPADSVGGDTYDYTLDRETVHVSVTDAMGHDVGAALLAMVLVAALHRRVAPAATRPGRPPRRTRP